MDIELREAFADVKESVREDIKSIDSKFTILFASDKINTKEIAVLSGNAIPVNARIKLLEKKYDKIMWKIIAIVVSTSGLTAGIFKALGA